MTPEDWDSGFGKSLAVFLNGDGIPEPDQRGQRVVDDTFLLCFNAHHEPIDFVTSGGPDDPDWTVALDTDTPDGLRDLTVAAGESVQVHGVTVRVLSRSGSSFVVQVAGTYRMPPPAFFESTDHGVEPVSCAVLPLADALANGCTR